MDIRVSAIQSAYAVHAAKKIAPVSKGADRVSKRDSVSFSSFANELNVARRALSEVPDVRMPQVERLAAAIQSGTYSVPAADVAARIFSVEE